MRFIKIGNQIININAITRIMLNVPREIHPSDQAVATTELPEFVHDVVIELSSSRSTGYPEIVRLTGRLGDIAREFFNDLSKRGNDSIVIDLEEWKKNPTNNSVDLPNNMLTDRPN